MKAPGSAGWAVPMGAMVGDGPMLMIPAKQLWQWLGGGLGLLFAFIGILNIAVFSLLLPSARAQQYLAT